MRASVVPIAGRSCNTPRTPPRTSFAELAPHTAVRTERCRAPRPLLMRSQAGWRARKPPTARPIRRRSRYTSGSARTGRTQRQPASSAARSAQEFRVPSARSPTRTVVPPRNRAPRAGQQSIAIVPHAPCQPQNPARTAAAKTIARRMHRPRPARRLLSARARRDLHFAQFHPPRPS